MARAYANKLGKLNLKFNKSSDQPKWDLSDKLDSLGKLTKTKWEHRKKFGLCMFCSNAGHMVSKCNKHKAAELRGRSANTTEPNSSSSSEK